jgi:hypothetical protein
MLSAIPADTVCVLYNNPKAKDFQHPDYKEFQHIYEVPQGRLYSPMAVQNILLYHRISLFASIQSSFLSFYQDDYHVYAVLASEHLLAFLVVPNHSIDVPPNSSLIWLTIPCCVLKNNNIMLQTTTVDRKCGA